MILPHNCFHWYSDEYDSVYHFHKCCYSCSSYSKMPKQVLHQVYINRLFHLFHIMLSKHSIHVPYMSCITKSISIYNQLKMSFINRLSHCINVIMWLTLWAGLLVAVPVFVMLANASVSTFTHPLPALPTTATASWTPTPTAPWTPCRSNYCKTQGQHIILELFVYTWKQLTGTALFIANLNINVRSLTVYATYACL